MAREEFSLVVSVPGVCVASVAEDSSPAVSVAVVSCGVDVALVASELPVGNEELSLAV